MNATAFVIGTAVFFVVLRRRGHHVYGSVVIGAWLTLIVGSLAQLIA